MTARLPAVGGDDNDWGTILNEFLEVSHNGDGTLQTSAMTAAGAITSVNGKMPTSGSVTLAASDVSALAASQLGQANGVAALDSNGFVPTAQLQNPVTAVLTDKGGQVLNVKAYGATGNGTTDDTAALSAAINAVPAAGGTVYIPAGVYSVSSPLPSLATNVAVIGSGPGSMIKLASSWSGSSVFNLPNFNSTVASLQFIGGPHTTNLSDAGSNPAATMIEIAAGQYCTIRDIDSQYCNGWIIEATADSSNGCQGLIAQNIRGTRNGYGIHTKGVSGSNYNVQVQLSNINMQQVSLGDVILIEDSFDVQVSQVNAAIIGSIASNASTIRVHGKCASIFLYNIDVGSWPTMPALTPTVLIESGTNGTPEDVHMGGGIVQQGLHGIDITGTDVYISDLTISENGTGVVFQSGSTGSVKTCTFRSNGQTSGSNYEVNCISTQQPIWLSQNNFLSPQGSGVGYVANVGQHSSYSNGAAWLDNDFNGSGFTASTVFGLTPKYAFRNRNYNPFGEVSTSVPSSGNATSGASFDRFFYITAGTGGCTALVASTTITIPAGQLVTVFVPAGQTLTPTYTNAPTWVVCAN